MSSRNEDKTLEALFDQRAEFDVSAPELDALFADARSSQPQLRDDNFTKLVINSLPKAPSRRRNQGISFDLVGIILGLLAVYTFFDVGRFASGVINMIPQTITLSPLHVIVVLASITAMSIAAWWTVENNRS